MRPVLLPPHARADACSTTRCGNKREKLDLEACVMLPDGRLVAFGSGSTPVREQLVVWSGQRAARRRRGRVVLRELRAAVDAGRRRGSMSRAPSSAARGSSSFIAATTREARRVPMNAIAELDARRVRELGSTARAARRASRASRPSISATCAACRSASPDAVALDDERVVVLACAEDSACAIVGRRGARLPRRPARRRRLTMVDVRDASGERTTAEARRYRAAARLRAPNSTSPSTSTGRRRRRSSAVSCGSGVSHGAAARRAAERSAAESGGTGSCVSAASCRARGRGSGS